MMELLKYLITILNTEQLIEVTNILKSSPELFSKKDLEIMEIETELMKLEISKNDEDNYEKWVDKMQKDAIKKLLNDNDIDYE
tara:strand:- start:5653 stop:5901 length:249 start_codon:yes stop_codon:yes gene_type:complete